MVEDLIKGFIDSPWLHTLDYSTLEKIPGNYISKRLKKRHSDVVWRVSTGGEYLYIYILIEFQSKNDPFMSVRMLGYLSLLYQDLIKRKQILPDNKLPPILPIVYYNGRKKWTAATNIADLIPKLPDLPPELLPSLKYLLIDENNYTPEQLFAFKNLVAYIMLVDKPCNLENLQICIEKLASLLQNHPELNRLFTDVIPVLLELRGVDEPELPKLKNLEELNMTFAKLLKKSRKEALIEGIEQGIEQGIEKGFEKGIEKGRKEGEILVLQRQLTRKFGTLPDYLTGKIAHASQQELESWLDKVIDADNLDGIFQ